MSERQIVVTYSCEGWDEDDHTYLAERVSNVVSELLPKTEYIVEEFEK